MTIFYYLLLTLLMFFAVLLILLILIQKGRGGGLSSAFGGSGGSTAFGAKTGDVLTWATSAIFGIFIILAICLDLVVSSQYKSPVASTAAPITTTPIVPANTTPDVPPPAADPTTQSVGPVGAQLLNAATRAIAAKVATTHP